MKFALKKFLLIYVWTEGIISTTQQSTTVTTEPTTTSLPKITLTNNNPSIIWNPTSNDKQAIEVEEGFKIGMIIKECNIDGTKGEYALVSTSENFDNNHTLLFTYDVKNTPSYLFNLNIIYVSFVATSASIFEANFTRIGTKLASTTTETPTTTIILPTPSPSESYEITVYLGGKNSSEYKNKDVQDLLKEIISAMATEYCGDQQFELAENITTGNVILAEILQCSSSWPNFETCVELTFAVPIDLNEGTDSSWAGYQLNADHLRIMWDRYADKYLTGGLTVYSEPPTSKWVQNQIILIAGVTVLFVVILLLIRHVTVKISNALRKRQRKMSDTASIISSNDRKSQISLPPHYLQEIPAIFENAYTMYNPGSASPYASGSFEFPDYHEVRGETKNKGDDDQSDMTPLEESGA